MNAVGQTWVRAPGPASPGLRIGLLGGSFNPAHEGHLHVAEVALKRLGLDYVWWLVSPQNPLKPESDMAPLAQRVARARAVTRRHPRLRVTGIEARLGTRYTIDTIARLKERFPQLRFAWLMGSDNLATFHRWREWRRLARLVPIAVVMRPGSELAALTSVAARRFATARIEDAARFARAEAPAFIVLDAKRSPTSGTAIRSRSVGPRERPVVG